MRRAAAWPLALLGLLLGARAGAQPGPGECAPHALEPAAVKESLRRWSGLGPFAQWRLVGVGLDACAREGRVEARLELAPPEKWSKRALPYRLRLDLGLDADAGSPARPAPETWRAIPAELKRLIGELETDEDVGRFLARFRVVRVELRPAEGGGGWLAAVWTDPGPHQAVERGAAMTYRSGAPGGVASYQLPRMDAWPARRELLRFLEVLSLRHPGCRPTWLEARCEPAPPPSAVPDATAASAPSWTLRAELLEASADGRACPSAFQAAIAPDGVVAEVRGDDARDGAKGN